MRAAIADRHRSKDNLSGNGMRLLAEKIETNSDLLEARALGYTYFQGYFFPANPRRSAPAKFPRTSSTVFASFTSSLRPVPITTPSRIS